MSVKVNFSKKVELASSQIRDAERHFIYVMQTEYPVDCKVRVIHSRGAYTGFVIGHEVLGRRVGIQNDKSGKQQYVWFEQVEVISK